MMYGRNTLEQQLAKIKQVAEMSLSGKTDEEVANAVGESVSKIIQMRSSAGIRKTFFKDIMNEWKKSVSTDKGTVRVDFRLRREHLIDLGIDPDKVSNGASYSFRGAAVNKKLLLTFKET